MHIYINTSNKVGFNGSNVLFGEMSFSVCNKVVIFKIKYSGHYIFNCLKQNKTSGIVGLLQHLLIKYKVEKFTAIK